MRTLQECVLCRARGLEGAVTSHNNSVNILDRVRRFTFLCFKKENLGFDGTPGTGRQHPGATASSIVPQFFTEDLREAPLVHEQSDSGHQPLKLQ